MGKAAVYGNTIVEVQKERERQMQNAPRSPSMLQEIIASHMMQRDDEAIEARLRASAKLRANPASYRKVPVTEMEKLVADAPKSSAQVIGNHKVPTLTALPEKKKKNPTELDRMRSYYPGTESAAIGFHFDFATQSDTMAKEADALIGGLSLQQAKDPKIAAALAAIQQRTMTLGKHAANNGVPRGVQRKGDSKQGIFVRR